VAARALGGGPDLTARGEVTWISVH
jgi:hypothetical protein